MGWAKRTASCAREDDGPGNGQGVLRRRRLDAIPLKRLGRPEEAADAVAILAPAPAGFIDGHNPVIAGGFYIP